MRYSPTNVLTHMRCGSWFTVQPQKVLKIHEGFRRLDQFSVGFATETGTVAQSIRFHDGTASVAGSLPPTST